MIGPAVYSKLSGTTAITNVVSTRILPGKAPEGTAFPFLVYALSDYDPGQLYTGASDLQRIQLTVACVDDSYLDVSTLAAAVKTALVEGTWGTKTIVGVFLDGYNESDEQDADTGGVVAYVIELQYTVVFR